MSLWGYSEEDKKTCTALAGFYSANLLTRYISIYLQFTDNCKGNSECHSIFAFAYVYVVEISTLPRF